MDELRIMKREKDSPSSRKEGRTARARRRERGCITENRWRGEERDERDKQGG